jgi:hypothetical protein
MGILGNWTSGSDICYFLADVHPCLLVRMYARVGGCMLLSFSEDVHYFSADIHRGPPDIR